MSGSFLRELQRRNVFRVAAIYVVIAWLLMQIGDVMFPALRLPQWSTTLLIAFLLLGLPVALIFAWAFELTPDGVARSDDVPPGQSITASTGQKINYMIIGVLALAVVFLLAKIWLFGETAPVPASVVSDRSIAVLPFRNESASEENAEFFSGGLHDELLTLLSRLGDLRVISRTSVERLDPGLSVPEIGALLGVTTVLEGQVQRAGDRLRINVQLIDTAREGHLWANTYDSELTAENVFQVQTDIARTIADALHAELSPEDEQLLNKVGTENLQALEKYLLGVQIAKRHTFTALEEGASYLVEATKLDPGFAQAWAELSMIYSGQFATGAISLDDYADKARGAVDRALALDATMPAAHAALGTLELWTGNLEAAEAAYREALRLDPDDSRSRDQYAFYLRMTEQTDAAVKVIERALVTDPLSTELWFQLGKAEMYAGRFGRSLDASKRILEIDPSNIYGYNNSLQVYLWTGRFDLAFTWFVKSLAIDPGDYENWAHAAILLEYLGDSAAADRYLSRAEALGPEEPVVLKCRVLLLTGRGDVESAVEISRAVIDAGLNDRWASDQVFYRMLRDNAFESGDLDEVMVLYRARWPELFLEAAEIDVNNWYIAPDVALLLQRSGQQRESSLLVDSAIEWYEKTVPAGVYRYPNGIVKPELLAVGGQPETAIGELRKAIDSGWRLQWRFYLLGRNLDSISEDPRYLEIVNEVEADMARQGEALRNTPYLGEYDLRDQP